MFQSQKLIIYYYIKSERRNSKSANGYGSQKHVSVSNSQGEVRNTSLAFSPLWQKFQEFFGFLEESILFEFFGIFEVKFLDFMLNPFCRTFREFLFFHFGHFSGIFRHIVETLVCWNCPSLGRCSAPGFSRKRRRRKRSPVRFLPRCAGLAHHAWWWWWAWVG